MVRAAQFLQFFKLKEGAVHLHLAKGVAERSETALEKLKKLEKYSQEEIIVLKLCRQLNLSVQYLFSQSFKIYKFGHMLSQYLPQCCHSSFLNSANLFSDSNLQQGSKSVERSSTFFHTRSSAQFQVNFQSQSETLLKKKNQNGAQTPCKRRRSQK